MPWSETTAMDERRRFVTNHLFDGFSIAQLCAIYGVSRPTGYKWVGRFRRFGEGGLADRSRRPLRCPTATSAELVAEIVAARRAHPHWGPKKLIAVLRGRFPQFSWPAVSTAGGILKRHGLVPPRPRRRSVDHPGYHPVSVTEPNQLWTSDFKGEFRMGNSQYCYPLTVADRYSRYVLACEALDSTAYAPARKRFERLFERYGLPDAILTDNGVPFASPGMGRLSRMSVWWIRLGITPLTIQPAKPQQNGAHERMHRTLKQQTARPPRANRQAQQKAFDRFRLEYNRERPHEALGQTPPERHYRSSARSFPSRLPEPQYPGHFEVRRVDEKGSIRWKSNRLYLTLALAGEDVALEESDDQVWAIFFGPRLLGRFDQWSQTLMPIPR